MLFEDAYKEYLIYAQKRHKKQGFVTLQSKLNSKIYPYFKNYNIFSITKKNILDWQDWIYTFDFKNSYNESLFVQLSSLFDFFVNYYDLPFNVVKSVKPFVKKNEVKNCDFYNLDEFNLFIKGFDDLIYKTFFEFLYYTGLRPGEAMALKFNDICGDYIIVNKNLCTKGGRTLDTPKNFSSIRNVKIDRKLKQHLFDLLDFYPGNENWRFDYFIFGGSSPLSPSTINRRKKDACTKVNIRPITLHQFRHSHATLLLNKGIIINEISRRLGHSKVSTTLDIYTHTDLNHEKRVYKILNSLRFNIFDTLQSKLKNIKHLLKH